MTQYFLAPRSSERVYKNFDSTMRRGVPYQNIEPYLNDEGKKILSAQRIIYAWGNRKGREPAWRRMETGDTVVFYDTGALVVSGEVIHKQHGDELGLAMWPPDENDQPWAYTYFLTNLRYFRIPIAHFNEVSGYNFTRGVQGFQEISEPHLKRILEHYSSMEAMLKIFENPHSPDIVHESDRVHLNLPPETLPELSNKVIVPHQPPKTGDPSKAGKRSGYVDFEAVHKKNAKTGSLGEEFVLRHERSRLLSKGMAHLASQVRQVSLENTSAGYDIISYNEDGTERKIEVKSSTSKQSKTFSFYISRNEKKIAEREENYFIYLVFDVNGAKPKIHPIENPFKKEGELLLEPVSYRAKGDFV